MTGALVEDLHAFLRLNVTGLAVLSPQLGYSYAIHEAGK